MIQSTEIPPKETNKPKKSQTKFTNKHTHAKKKKTQIKYPYLGAEQNDFLETVGKGAVKLEA